MSEPITVHTFDEHKWPEFTVESRPNADVRLHCSDCQWYKDFTGPAQWSVLTTATVRHGMGHQEEDE